MLVLLGCESTKRYGEGDVYVVNNSGLASCLRYYTVVGGDLYHLIVEWEGERIKIKCNMDVNGNSTGVGAVRITSEPLEGGLSVDFAYCFLFVGDEKVWKFSDVLEEEALVDGDITIELYSERWDPSSWDIVVLGTAHRGKFDGIHIY